MINEIKGFLQSIIDKIHWRGNKWSPQIKATILPYASCFGHSMAWFLENFGISITPDDVMAEINSAKWFQETIRIEGRAAAEQYRGKVNQLWKVQAAYANAKLAAAKVSATAVFGTGLDDGQIHQALRHAPVICSITPRHDGRRIGHVVLIVGSDGAGRWIVDDPFGDFRRDYPVHDRGGDDIPIERKAFRRLMAGLYIYARR